MLMDDTNKTTPRRLAFTLFLFVALVVAGTWTYLRFQESEMDKQQQRILEEAAIKKQMEVERGVCLAEAEQKYYRYLEINGKKIKRKDGSISYQLAQDKIGVAFTELNEAEKLCFEKYPILK